MHLEKVITYKGKEYMVSLDLHNEKELNKQTIGLAEEKLIVSARVANSNYKIIYKVEDRISLTDKKSLVNFLKETVKAAYDKENLEQIEILDVWDGNIDKELVIKCDAIDMLGNVDIYEYVDSFKPKRIIYNGNTVYDESDGKVNLDVLADIKSSEVTRTLKDDNSQDIKINVTFNAPLQNEFDTQKFLENVKKQLDKQIERGI
ncbi:hypothetical protein AAXE64_07785 [Priestia megaterium]